MTAAGHREWDAGSYHRVSDPQFAWGLEVLERLSLRGDETVIDAGCGTGRLTARLLDRLPRGRVVAVDRSLMMLRAARDHLGSRRSGCVHCVQADLLDLPLAGCGDAVFSTATFHWVRDHPRLFAELHRALRPGGRLVAQCGGPGNLERLHRRVGRLMDTPPFAVHRYGWEDPWEFADAATTAERLRAAGFLEVDTWTNEAPTVLADATAYAEFAATVVLRVHLAHLPDERLRARLLDEMTRLAADDDPPFCLDYRRLNLSALRP